MEAGRFSGASNFFLGVKRGLKRNIKLCAKIVCMPVFSANISRRVNIGLKLKISFGAERFCVAPNAIFRIK